MSGVNQMVVKGDASQLLLIGNRQSPMVIKQGVVNTISVKNGDIIHVIEKKGAEEVAAKDVIALKNGDTLELIYPNNTVVAVENFYSSENVICELPSNATSDTMISISPTSSSIASLQDGTQMVYATGNPDMLAQMSYNNSSLQLAVNDHMAFVHAPRFADAGNVATDAMPAGEHAPAGAAATTGLGATQVLLGAVVIGGVAAAAGGGGGGSSSTPADTTVPTATITMSDTALKIGDTATVTITFSEAVSGFSNADVAVANGTLSTFTSSNNITWTATFTPTSNIEDATNVISLANTYADVAGNAGTTASSANYSVDTLAPTAPTVALTTDTGASSSDHVTTNAALTITGVETSATVQYSSDGTNWSTTQPSATEGSNTLHVRQTDAAGNVSSVADFSYTLDTTAPVLTGIAAHSSNSTIVLTYDSVLDATNAPEVNDFIIMTGGVPNTVASVVVSGTTVTLTMLNSFSSSASVAIDYSNGGSNTALAIQDIAGNDAAAMSVSSGLVADGYVRGAEIWIDTNGDGVKDYDTGVTTDANGNFFLMPGTPSGTIIAVGGVNIDTGVVNTMELKAPEGSTVINPLTTLVQAVIEQSGGSTTTTAATAQVVQALGLTTGTDLTTFDPISAAQSSDTSVQATALAAQKVAATIATITTMAETATNSSTAENTIITQLATQVTTATAPVDLTDNTTVATLLNSVTTDTNVIANITSASTDIAAATDITAISQTQSTYLDTIAPGTSTVEVVTPSNDTTPSVKVYLNTVSTDGTAVVVGDTVTLVVDGFLTSVNAILTSTDMANGYVTLSAATLSDGTYTVSAQITDQANNMGFLYPSQTIVIDTLAPTAPTVALTTDTGASSSDHITTNAALTITGVETGATVQYSSDGTNWSTTQPSATEGINTVHVRQTDAAGNVSSVTDFSYTLDATAPTATITMSDTALKIGDTSSVIITFSEAVSGFSNANVSVANGTLSTLTSSDNITWTATFTPITGVQDTTGVISLSNYTDSAGNIGISTVGDCSIDTMAPATPIVALVTDAGTSSTDKITNVATVTVSNAESGSTVEYSSDGTNWSTTQPTATEGSNTLHVRQTDAAGNVSAVTDFTYTYDITAPTKIDSTKGIFSVQSDSAVTVNNVDGAYGAKLVLTSDNTIKVESSSLFDTTTDTALVNVSAQATVTSTRAVAYDDAGNALKTSSHIFLGTTGNDTITSDTTNGDAMFGFGGTDTFSLMAGSSVETIADYESGESITLGSTLSLWSSANAPTNWSIDSNGMATYTGDTSSISDLATQFFTDFKAVTGVAGAVVGLVANGKTYIFGEGATTADTDNYQTRMFGVSDTTGLDISSGSVQLVLPSAVDFDITTLLSSGVRFYSVWIESSLEYSQIMLQGTSGTYTDYSYDGSSYQTDSSGTVSLTNNGGVITVSSEGVTESLTFTNAHAVSNINGIDTTGLNQVTVNFTVLSVPTVQTATDWAESGYTYWDDINHTSVAFTSLQQLVDASTTGNYAYSVGEGNLHVTLLSNGSLHVATGSDTTVWTDSGTSINGSWSLSSEYLIITVDNVGTTAFKMDTNGTMVLYTQINAVGTIYSETWYYGVPDTEFIPVLTEVFDSILQQNTSNVAPEITLHNGIDFFMDVNENATTVATVSAHDTVGSTLTYSLSGDDASLFTVSSSGILAFSSAPNYENPTGVNQDNTYNVTVTVTDQYGASDSQNIGIVVNDVNEGTPVTFDAASKLANGGTFYSLYEGGNEFEQIVLNSNGTGTYSDYKYDASSGYFITSDAGTFTYTNNNGTISITTSMNDGHQLETMVLSNAQTAVSSEGTDISSVGLDQVTATFTVVTPSDLSTTQDWWQANYTYWDSVNNQSVTITDLTTLTTQLVTNNAYMNVWINEDVQVSLNSDGTLTEMVWDGTYNSGPDGEYKELVRGSDIASADGSWTLDTTNGYLTVSVGGVGEAVFKVDNGTILKTEIDAVGSTDTQTLYYSDTKGLLDIGNAIANVIDPDNYQGLIATTKDSNGITLMPQGSVILDLSSLLSSMNSNSVYKIDIADSDNADILTLTADTVEQLGTNDALYISMDNQDILDVSGWTQGATDSNGYVSYTAAATDNTNVTLYVHTI